MLTCHFCGHFGSHVNQTSVSNYESSKKTLQLLTNIHQLITYRDRYCPKNTQKVLGWKPSEILKQSTFACKLFYLAQKKCIFWKKATLVKTIFVMLRNILPCERGVKSVSMYSDLNLSKKLESSLKNTQGKH